MTAFDTAWDLLKMPIVRGTLRAGEDPDSYSAKFRDPVSQEEMDMQARWLQFPDPTNEEYWKSGEITAEIKHPPDDTYNLGDRASAHFGDDHGEDNNNFFSYGTGVDEEYKRRGYATALYDLVARILHEEGEYNLTPSTGQNEMSRGLWGDKESWPVRDDL
tara:strand:- start:862 stop:1344 length:483 start_codon:yes stop_codon:yes gene_type:complete